MNKSATIHAGIESETKEKTEGVLKELGMSPTEAIRLFYNQICLRGGIPFPILIPNEATKKHWKEVLGAKILSPKILLQKCLIVGIYEKVCPNLSNF